MKFKYIGSDNSKDLDLVVYKVLEPTDILMKGTIIEVPDNMKDLIRRLRINGSYEEIPETPNRVRGRKRKRR
ncbi:MAG: hypothetical protein HUJ56_11655 [Erysipelotrichaceae bacterium]|nr:hypothetical protein [Erysipelotrichaceae bacterium]